MGTYFNTDWRKNLPVEMQKEAYGRWEIGDRMLSRYQITQILGGPGKSGMGIVYVCYDQVGKKLVAIKTYQHGFLRERVSMKRFKWEAETWMRLGQHHTATIP